MSGLFTEDEVDRLIEQAFNNGNAEAGMARARSGLISDAKNYKNSTAYFEFCQIKKEKNIPKVLYINENSLSKHRSPEGDPTSHDLLLSKIRTEDWILSTGKGCLEIESEHMEDEHET
jgi:hypothetical protein